MSFTATFLPILAVLGCAEQFLNLQTPWQPVNYQQVTFLNRYYPYKNELNKLADTELCSLASKNVDEVNQFLRDHHFSIQLNPEPNSVCYAASVLDIMVQWLHKGEEVSLFSNNTLFPAIQLTQGYCIYAIPGYTHELIKISTQSGDSVYITRAEKPRHDFELLDVIRSLTNYPAVYDLTDEYSDLIFPMVDLNQEVDISWLVNMYVPCPKTQNPDMWIAKALQQTKLQMNEEGAAVQSAVAITMLTKVMPIRSSYIIDQPFYLWIMRKGVSIPLFAGYIDQSDWKKPLKLGH